MTNRNLKAEMAVKGNELHRYVIYHNNGTIANACGQVFRSVNNNGLYEIIDEPAVVREEAVPLKAIQSQRRHLLKRLGWYQNDRSGYSISKKRKRFIGYLKKCPRIEWVSPNIVRLIPSELGQEYPEDRINKDAVKREAPADKKRHFVHRLICRIKLWLIRLLPRKLLMQTRTGKMRED